MPYKNIDELPKQVQGLPDKAKKIFMNTFNAVYDKYGEKKAFKIAWAAVKKSYKKIKGKWEHKSFDEGKDINVVPKLGEKHEHVLDDPNILPISKVVDSRVDKLDDYTTGLWVKTKLNKFSPKYEAVRGSIEEGYYDSYSIEYIKDDDGYKTITTPDITIRELNRFDLTGITYTGKPVNTECRITNFYEDENGDFYTEGYAIVSNIDRWNDLVSDEAIIDSNRQIQTALNSKSEESIIEVKPDTNINTVKLDGVTYKLVRLLPEESKAVWSRAYINSLPDSSFAYIEPGGKKDDEGKTVPRSLRHLPYKDKSGKIDVAHLRNALARLEQTDIPASAKASARKKLVAAAKKVKVEVSENKEGGKSMDENKNEELKDKDVNTQPPVNDEQNKPETPENEDKPKVDVDKAEDKPAEQQPIEEKKDISITKEELKAIVIESIKELTPKKKNLVDTNDKPLEEKKDFSKMSLAEIISHKVGVM
ncbi:MAG: ChaB family protein [Candidatus Heimdallarchaeaceae archaeon]